MTCSQVVSTMVSTRSRAALCALLGLCLSAGLTPRADAAASSYVVTRTADDTSPGSLRYAIAQAAGTGGAITFAIPASDPGYSSTANADTITLALGTLVVPGSLTIAAPVAPAAAVVVSGGTGVNASRVFSVTGGTVAFSNLTITKGNADDGIVVPSNGGGGILNTAALTLTGCTVTGNTTGTGDGGGINNNGAGASLTMTGCTVSGNGSYFTNGGGIANSGTLLLTGCTLSGNVAPGVPLGFNSGGGLYNTSTATLNACTLSSNGTAGQGGGGGGAASTGTGTVSLTLNNCLVSGNSAGGSGGGILSTGASGSTGTVSLTLNNCLVSGNSTGSMGDGFFANGPASVGGGIAAAGTLTLSACIISENLAYGGRGPGIGGGIYTVGTAQITDCLVVGNRSQYVGGLDSPGALTLLNSTFTGNGGALGTLYSGPATVLNDIFYGDAGIEIAAASGTAGPTVTYSDVQGGYPGTGNISADPQFAGNPSPLTTFPGDPGDEHLLLTSPAVHAGTNAPGVPLTDIEGTLRPTPPATPSMGAYEVPGAAGGFSAQGGFTVTGTQNASTGPQVVAKFLPGATPVASFTALVNFGDGSASAAGAIVPDPNVVGVFDVTVSHTYAGYGLFTLTVTISGPGGTPTAMVTSTANIQPALVAADVTSQVSVNRGGLVYNRAAKRYIQTVTITDTGSAALTGPFSLVLDSLTPGAVLVNPSGTTQYAPPAGSPYQNANVTGLAPGASLSLVVQFTYAGTARFGYTPRVLSGPGAR